MKLPSYDKRSLLRHFIVGSLIVILLCVTVASSVLALAFLKKENRRAATSREQVLHFFKFHYSQMAEELYTKSYEGIHLRVASIAQEVGDADFEIVIADESGHCVFRGTKTNGPSQQCQIPSQFGSFIKTGTHSPAAKGSLAFDKSASRYVYMVPLYVGPLLNGFIHATLSDPFDFYRGGFVGVLGRALIPVISLILLVWVVWLFICRKVFLKPYLKHLEEMKDHESMAKLARRTAHDIRDPIHWIGTLTSTLTEVDEEKRSMIKGAVLHLNDVANGLLAQSKLWTMGAPHDGDTQSEKMSVELLSHVVTIVVSEKRIQYKASKPGVTIRANLNPQWYGLFARLQPKELKRILSNLINNSVEAIDTRGDVVVDLLRRDGKVVLQIADTGIGIPPEVIPKLGDLGATFGKKRGNGLGLHFAKTLVESWAGELLLTSEVGRGTKVELLLPDVEPPAWFVPQIRLPFSSSVVVIDDHPSIHQVWDERFQTSQNGKGSIQVTHFSEGKEFIRWHKKHESEGGLYLCDYELLGQPKTGIDIVEELGISDKTILVTSHFEDEEIREECKRLGIRLIPKDLAPFVPISVEHFRNVQRASLGESVGQEMVT